MNKPQLYTLGAFLLLFIFIAFGLRTKPMDLIQQEKTRMLNIQATDISILKNEALDNLSGADKSRIQILESQSTAISDTSEKIDIFKDLSSVWFELGNYSIAGYYAEEIAKLNPTAEAWGIAGTTYALGANRSTVEKEIIYCRDKAIETMEIAISENPENIEYQINRAIVLAQHPIAENPMKGILLLLELNKNFPKNVSVINNLARFALQTNQLDKALERLNQALQLEPENIQTNCLLSEVYEKKGDLEMMNLYKRLCDN